MAKRVVVVPYNEQWKTDFETIKQHLLPIPSWADYAVKELKADFDSKILLLINS